MTHNIDKEHFDGNAIVYCQGAFNTPNGKTAHGLVRFTKRYRVLSVIDSRYAGQDAGEVLDGKPKNIPIVKDLDDAVNAQSEDKNPATHFVVGLAPDGGRLSSSAREDVKAAIQIGLNMDCGLHDFLSDDKELAALAREHNVILRDVRKPPAKDQLHFFSGKIEEVTCLKVAMLGTDSAVGKRTTAWLLVHALQQLGHSTEMVGTGQTAWMQGARFSLITDSLISDFMAGEIEHAVWSAWKEAGPEVIVLEGQGSLMNPAYPGGYELIAAGRPDVIVLQHAPARRDYDGFPGYRIHPLAHQIQALELISGKPVIAITLNHENIPHDQIPLVCEHIQQIIGLPTFDPLISGGKELAETVVQYLDRK